MRGALNVGYIQPCIKFLNNDDDFDLKFGSLVETCVV